MSGRVVQDLRSFKGAMALLTAMVVGALAGPVVINLALSAWRDAYPPEPFVQPLDWTFWVEAPETQRVNLVYQIPHPLQGMKVVGRIFNAETNAFVCEGVAYLPADRPGRFPITNRRLDRWLQPVDGETACLDRLVMDVSYVLEPMFCDGRCEVGQILQDKPRPFVHGLGPTKVAPPP